MLTRMLEMLIKMEYELELHTRLTYPYSIVQSLFLSELLAKFSIKLARH